MPHDTRKTLFDQLLCHIPGQNYEFKLTTMDTIHLHILTAISNCSAHPFLEVSLARTDKIDADFDVLPDEFLT
jgi:hypothetical protein